MGRANLICFVVLCLFGSAAPALAAPQPRPASPAADQKQRDEAGRAQSQAAAPHGGVRSGGRRRNNYAFCNRESHKRNLRGGARRRFLIRCKLGYEQRQPSRPAEPPASGRRP